MTNVRLLQLARLSENKQVITMNTVKIKEEIRNTCTKMAGELTGYRIVLFGSRATGKARDRSDFDIGVLGDIPLPLKTFYKMEDSFDEIETLYRIDLVDLNRVSPEFRREALKKTETLYG
jgi:predicted nucleotidyltransferase